MQPGLVALLLAVLVAIPVVGAGIVSSSGGDDSGGAAAPAVQEDRAAEAERPRAYEAAEAERPRAYEDCLESVKKVPARCEALLDEDSRATVRYLKCRDAGIAAGRCLRSLSAPPRSDVSP